MLLLTLLEPARAPLRLWMRRTPWLQRLWLQREL
jgi:hypothetical protein